jgi:hypothetical protein
MKTIETGRISTKGQTHKKIEWRHDCNLRVDLESEKTVLLYYRETNQFIKLPVNHWKSLIVFLAEAMAISEAQTKDQYKTINITLTVDEE